MRLKDYGRNPAKRKAYVRQEGLLLVGIDISKAKHDACIGTLSDIIQHKLTFSHICEGFDLFEKTLRKSMFKARCRRVLIANRGADPRARRMEAGLPVDIRRAQSGPVPCYGA